jgi:broad specificity phosphatase PhoE
MKNLRIDLIYSADFFRTKQTAEIVAKELNKKIIFDKRLRDINLGIYRGRKKEEFYRDFLKVFPLRFTKRPPGGESWQDVQKRMLNFLKKIDKKHKGKNILIVSHGDPLWLLEGAIKGWNLEKFSKISQPNYIQPGELRKL